MTNTDDNTFAALEAGAILIHRQACGLLADVCLARGLQAEGSGNAKLAERCVFDAWRFYQVALMEKKTAIADKVLRRIQNEEE